MGALFSSEGREVLRENAPGCVLAGRGRPWYGLDGRAQTWKPVWTRTAQAPASFEAGLIMLAYFACIDSKICYLLSMNSAHKKTLAAVFSNPVPKNLEWSKIEALLVACGCKMYEGNGSRVSFSRENFTLDAHRPHPGKEAKPYQVRNVRDFLEKVGLAPGKEGK